MKTKALSLFLCAGLLSSCSSPYDSYGGGGGQYGNVTPAGATAIAAVAGLAGYQLSKNRYKDDKKNRRHYYPDWDRKRKYRYDDDRRYSRDRYRGGRILVDPRTGRRVYVR